MTAEEKFDTLVGLNSWAPVTHGEKTVFNQTRQRAIEAMNGFASQAVEDYKEKLKAEIERLKEVNLDSTSPSFTRRAAYNQIQTLIDSIKA